MRTLLLGFALCLFAVQAQAQVPAKAEVTPQERPERMTERMTEELDLNETQVAAVTKLNKELADGIEAIQGLKKSDMEGFRAQRKELLKTHNNAILELLNEEQTIQYRQLRRSHRKARSSHGGRN